MNDLFGGCGSDAWLVGARIVYRKSRDNHRQQNEVGTMISDIDQALDHWFGILYALTIGLVVLAWAMNAHIRELDNQLTIVNASLDRAPIVTVDHSPATPGLISCDCRVVP